MVSPPARPRGARCGRSVLVDDEVADDQYAVSPVASFGDDVPELQVGVPVEAGVGLIQQQDVWVHQESQAEVQLRESAAGELLGAAGGVPLEAERDIEFLPRTRGCLVGHAVGTAEELEVLVAGEPRIDEGQLRAVAHPTQPFDRPAVGGQLSDQDLHQGGLAGAVLTDQPDYLAREQGDVGALQHLAAVAYRPHSTSVGPLDCARGE
jgi:hypothetical protein